MKKIAVVYYSLTGRTRHIAQAIAQRTSSDLIELKMKKPYSKAGSYVRGVADIRRGASPELASTPDLSGYDTVFIGTPVWYYTYVPVFNTLADANDLNGKEVYLFSTHQGGNGSTFEKLKEKLGIKKIASRQDFFDVDVKECKQSGVKGWLERMGI